jgi:hypothetical protein
MKLVFSSIINGTIFEPEFQSLTPDNGTITFKHMNTPGGIAVIYAPNGTGKTSLAKVLNSDSSLEHLSFKAVNDAGEAITPETSSFYIIPEQIDRNVIRGKETDYLIGQQIRREYELRDRINASFEKAFSDLNSKFKSEYKITKVGDFILSRIDSAEDELRSNAYSFLRSIINSKIRGRYIDVDDFVSYVRKEENQPAVYELETEKRTWLIQDEHKSKITEIILSLDYNSVVADPEAVQLEMHDDAIMLLKKYHDMQSCIVCDNPDFDAESLLITKNEKRNHIYENLDQSTKELLDKVVRDETLAIADPFDIKRIVSSFISGGCEDELIQLKAELERYVQVIGNEMITLLFHCFDGTTLFQDYDEYNNLVQSQPELDSEELLFIQDVINESIGKDISLVRDEESKNYKLKLGDKDLIGTDRKSMELSTGEQNFISLTFELLLARHSSKEYVVIDDPISSFDSIYKNKIAFCIVKFLESKKQLILTHNTDLIRLLDVQLSNCFNLYILNNVENGTNGFIQVSDREKKLLINLHELVKLFQNKDGVLVNAIRNRKLFLMAMVPFMRGYAHISLDPDDYFGLLSNIMHGYGTGSVDVVPIYQKLFGYDFNCSEVISVSDILSLDYNDLDILDKAEFPLLSDTLEQTLIYYYLRMKVEKELVDAFSIQANEMDTLNQIIQKAFRCRNTDADYEKKRDFRVFFTSRKTLLNEFNHFEGNMNIFQPAIDITPAALKKEIEGIEAKLVEVREFAGQTL